MCNKVTTAVVYSISLKMHHLIAFSLINVVKLLSLKPLLFFIYFKRNVKKRRGITFKIKVKSLIWILDDLQLVSFIFMAGCCSGGPYLFCFLNYSTKYSKGSPSFHTDSNKSKKWHIIKHICLLTDIESVNQHVPWTG